MEKTVKDIIQHLQSRGQQKNVDGMARFGIKPDHNLGVSVTEIRAYARALGQNHDLALELWDTGIRDARMLAASIDDPKKVKEEQMEEWVQDFDSWDVCDHVCGHLFDKTRFAYDKAVEWSSREEEFVKRAGFALMAWLAVHDKKQSDNVFERFLGEIQKQAKDDRNYVKKAVNWALRNIGKRNISLNRKAIATAKLLHKMSSSSARWIAGDALRELQGEKVQQRLQKKALKLA